LHTAQLMPLPLTVSCFSKIQIGFTFLVLAYLSSPGKRAVKCVCVRPLAKFEGGLSLLHKADDDTVIWLESTGTAALVK